MCDQPEDRVQRRPQLVRDGGQELVLHPVGSLGFRAGGVLAGQRLPAVLQLLLQPLVQPRVLDRVGRDPRVQIHEARLAVRRPMGLRKQYGQHPDGVAAPADQGRAVAGAEARLPGRLAIGRVDRVHLGVFDHHPPPLRVRGTAGAASRGHRLDAPEELVVEPGVHPQAQAGMLWIAQGEQAEPGGLHRHGRSQDLAEHGLHVEQAGQAHAGLVKPAEILDLALELAQPLAGGGFGRAAPGANDAGVPGADLRDRVRQVAISELLERVGAEELIRVRPSQLGPELLEAHGGGGMAAREEQADHLAEHAQPPPAARGARQLAADHLSEALRIGHAVDHDPRESLVGVEGDVAAGGARRLQVDTRRAQPPLEIVSMRGGGDHDAGLTGREAAADEARHGVGESGIRLVELYKVLEQLRLGHGRPGKSNRRATVMRRGNACSRYSRGVMRPEGPGRSPRIREVSSRAVLPGVGKAARPALRAYRGHDHREPQHDEPHAREAERAESLAERERGGTGRDERDQ